MFRQTERKGDIRRDGGQKGQLKSCSEHHRKPSTDPATVLEINSKGSDLLMAASRLNLVFRSELNRKRVSVCSVFESEWKVAEKGQKIGIKFM